MDKPNYIIKVKKNIIFKGLTEEEFDNIILKFQKVIFKKGQFIFNEGDLGDNIYIVVEGEAIVQKKIGLGMRKLKRLIPGDCFGEISLVSGEKRSASVKAVSHMVCLVLHKTDLFLFFKEIPQLNYNIMHLLSNRMKTSEALANKQILDAYQILIFSLSNLAESRDPDTGSHLYRVREYCRLLSQLLTNLPKFTHIISPLFIDSIYNVSPLHDIGKVGIPDSILLKQGRLSHKEFDVMKSHTTIGAKTINNVLRKFQHPTFQMASNIIHFHHEKYDGTGYPLKLKGSKIPLEARIMAIADVYDALVSKRVYKQAMSYEDTIKIIKEGVGTHFDPDIAEIMIANKEKFEKIHHQYENCAFT